jgi:hypothetical protein
VSTLITSKFVIANFWFSPTNAIKHVISSCYTANMPWLSLC